MTHSMTKSLFRASLLASLGMTIGLSGCQQLGLRQNDRDLLDPQISDDWEQPQSTSGVPRPRMGQPVRTRLSGNEEPVEHVVLPRDRKKLDSSVHARLSEESLQKPTTPSKTESSTQSGVVAVGQDKSSAPGEVIASKKPTPEPSINASATAANSTIIDTGVSDVDFETAVSSLPPQYRELVKQQLTAIQNRDKKQSDPKSLMSESSIAIASQTSSTPQLQNGVAASSTTTDSQPKNAPVSMRIVDGEVRTASTQNLPSSPNNTAVTASSNVPANSESKANTEVQTAVAIAPSVSEKQPPLPTPANTAESKPSSSAPPAIASSAAPNAANSNPNAWHQFNAQAIEALEKQLANAPAADENMRISQEVTLRFLYVAQRRLEDAVRPIDALPENEREFIRHQMIALYEASNPDANPSRSRHNSLIMNSQRDATRNLAAAANLEVRSAAFCTEVDGYGMTKKFPKYQFTPDQDVLLYCEIDNVAAEAVKNGFESQLQGSYEIRDMQGRRIADQLLPMEPEVCQNHRRDYFIVYRIYMPQQIAPGSYQLRLSVEDMKAHKYGQTSLDFEIKK